MAVEQDPFINELLKDTSELTAEDEAALTEHAINMKKAHHGPLMVERKRKVVRRSPDNDSPGETRHSWGGRKIF